MKPEMELQISMILGNIVDGTTHPLTAKIDLIKLFDEALSAIGEGWIELKEGCEMPDYDEVVLWYHEDGNTYSEALDKDGNPWIFGFEFDGIILPKATHWMPLPNPPSLNTNKI